MNQGKCFVIQPFNEATYEKRYADTFELAIRDAGAEPYRVDGDPGSDVIIDAIEKGIKKSDVCFAEITSDNPNVWYELGYALFHGKHVAMVCEKSRKLPFDIQHRRIIQYESDSQSDFENLKKDITDSIKIGLDKVSNMKKLTDPVSATSNYKMPPYILTALVIVMSNEELGGGVYFEQIETEMYQAGFNSLASNLAIRKLIHDGFLEKREMQNTFDRIIPTDEAAKWLLENQHDLDLTLRSDTTDSDIPPYAADDDLPF